MHRTEDDCLFGREVILEETHDNQVDILVASKDKVGNFAEILSSICLSRGLLPFGKTHSHARFPGHVLQQQSMQ